MSINAKAKRRGFWTWAVSLIAIAFGLMTIKEGGAVLLGDPAARSAAGDYVPFVLWFNFIAGFAYVIAGIGLWLQRRWAAGLALTIAAATVLVFIAFGIHVFSGGAYAQRTPVAMSARSLIWITIAVFALRTLGGGSSAKMRQ